MTTILTIIASAGVVWGVVLLVSAIWPPEPECSQCGGRYAHVRARPRGPRICDHCHRLNEWGPMRT